MNIFHVAYAIASVIFTYRILFGTPLFRFQRKGKKYFDVESW